MKHLRFLLIGAMVVGVALGIAIGPIFAATTASAQSPKAAHPGIWTADGSLWDAFLDNLAAALNIQRHNFTRGSNSNSTHAYVGDESRRQRGTCQLEC